MSLWRKLSSILEAASPRFGPRGDTEPVPGWCKGPAAPAEASGHQPWSGSAGLGASGMSAAQAAGGQAWWPL